MTATLMLQLTEQPEHVIIGQTEQPAAYLQLWRDDNTGKLEVTVGFVSEAQAIVLTYEQETQLKRSLIEHG